MILDTLFGEGQTGTKILLFLVVVLGLLLIGGWVAFRWRFRKRNSTPAAAINGP